MSRSPESADGDEAEPIVPRYTPEEIERLMATAEARHAAAPHEPTPQERTAQGLAEMEAIQQAREETIRMAKEAALLLADAGVGTDVQVEHWSDMSIWRHPDEPEPSVPEKRSKMRTIRNLGGKAIAFAKNIATPLMNPGAELPEGARIQQRMDPHPERPEIPPSSGVRGWALERGKKYSVPQPYESWTQQPAASAKFTYANGIMLSAEHGLLVYDGIRSGSKGQESGLDYLLERGIVRNPISEQASPYAGAGSIEGELDMQRRIAGFLETRLPRAA